MTLFYYFFKFYNQNQAILHHPRHPIKENYYGFISPGRTLCNYHKHLIHPLQFPTFSNTRYSSFDRTNLAHKKLFLAIEL